jgi:hypothetical protein
MPDNEKHFGNIREVERRISAGDRLTEKGSRVISQGPENPPQPPKTPSATVGPVSPQGTPPSGNKQ